MHQIITNLNLTMYKYSALPSLYFGLSCISSFWPALDVFMIPLQLVLSTSIPKVFAASVFNSEKHEGLLKAFITSKLLSRRIC